MKVRPVQLVVLIVIAIVGMAALATGGDQPGTVKSEGTTVTKNVSAIEPNATASFPIRLLEGGDAEHESEHIFGTLDHPSIARLEFDTVALTLTVHYDSNGTSEDSIRAQLASAGYIERSAEDAVAAQLAADGSGQTLHLVPGEALSPSFVRATSGVPLTITFSAGEGHLATVSIEALGITQDITAEGSSIVIENPVAGEYELLCAEGFADAVLLVE